MRNITYSDRWGKKRLGLLFQENTHKNIECIEKTAYQFYFGSIVPKQKFDLTPDVIEIYKKYIKIKQDDIIINGLNLNYDFISQRVGYVHSKGIITSAYICLRPLKDVNSRYYVFLLKAMDAQKVFHGLGTGIRKTLSFSELKNVLLPVPPREEQEQIVRFLDWKVSSINKLINIKQQEITELKELKKATISDAVTHGLDKTVPMKDSGIVWLGNIPKHWKLMRGKNLYLKLQRPVRKDDEVVTCFRDGTVTLRKHRRTTGFTEAINETGYQGIRKGDLIIHVMDAFAGSIGVSDSDGKGTPVYSVCQAKINLNNEYYAFLLREMARSGFIQSLYRGIRERSSDFRFEVFANQYYSVPPRNEQDQIARFLDARCADIDRLIAAKQTQITNLHDLKSSLIADVVTGQIDVRDVEISDYEQVAESLYEADDNATLHSEDEIPEEV